MQRRIVKQYNAPRLQILRHPLKNRLGIVVLPVQTVHIPLNRLHPHRPDGGDHMVVILPVGAADQRGGDACNGLHLVVARRHIRHDLISGKPVKVVVMIGVIHHLHSRIPQGLHGFRVFIHPVPHQKEGGLHIVPGQNVQEHLGVLVSPGGVKRNSAEFLPLLRRPFHAVYRQLPGCPRCGNGCRNVYRPENSRCRQHRPHRQCHPPG